MGADHRVTGQEYTPAKGPTPFGQCDKGGFVNVLTTSRKARQPAGRCSRTGQEEFAATGQRFSQVVVPVIVRQPLHVARTAGCQQSAEQAVFDGWQEDKRSRGARRGGQTVSTHTAVVGGGYA